MFLMFISAPVFRGDSANMEYNLMALALFLYSLLALWTQPVHTAPLSSYLVCSFTSPDPILPFNHIAFNNVTGDVYIGAVESLYQLNSDLILQQLVDVGKCPYPNEDKTNANQLLVIAPSPYEKLITCGSCDGFCETRSLNNVSQNVIRYADSEVHMIVSQDYSPSVGIVTLGSDFESSGEGTISADLYLYTGLSMMGTYIYHPISKYGLSNLYMQQRVERYNSIGTDVNKFVHLLSFRDYLYYIIQRNYAGKGSVHVGRLCPNSLDLKLDSYTEIELHCSKGAESYNMTKAAYIAPAGMKLATSLGIDSTDGVLFLALGDSVMTSASLCLYRMDDIQSKFLDAVEGCIEGDDSTEQKISSCQKVIAVL